MAYGVDGLRVFGIGELYYGARNKDPMLDKWGA